MTNRFEILATPLKDLFIVERKPIGDSRGWFERFFCQDEWQACGLQKPIVQMNRTQTQAKGSVRGMHFQHNPHLETKVVTCIKGEVFDIAVDLRPQSATYLKWYGTTLSAQNHRSFYIPDGFAHGFQTLTDDCELLYLHTERFAPQCADGLNPLDPTLGGGFAWNVEAIDDPSTVMGRSRSLVGVRRHAKTHQKAADAARSRAPVVPPVRAEESRA